MNDRCPMRTFLVRAVNKEACDGMEDVAEGKYLL